LRGWVRGQYLHLGRQLEQRFCVVEDDRDAGLDQVARRLLSARR